MLLLTVFTESDRVAVVSVHTAALATVTVRAVRRRKMTTAANFRK